MAATPNKDSKNKKLSISREKIVSTRTKERIKKTKIISIRYLGITDMSTEFIVTSADALEVS